MLQEGRACIITDVSGLKKALEAKRMTTENRKKISKSIANLNSQKLKKLYESK